MITKYGMSRETVHYGYAVESSLPLITDATLFEPLEDDRWLANKYNNGTDREQKRAAEEITKLYGNLAHSIAKKCRGRGVEYDDLVQSAHIGLLYALTKYNADKGKLSSSNVGSLFLFLLML